MPLKAKKSIIKQHKRGSPLNLHPLYEQDFCAWLDQNTQLLRQNRLADIDKVHLAEELEDMGKRERRALESYLRNVILHLLKWQYQPAFRGSSWRQSIRNGRIAIDKIIQDSPSLQTKINRFIENEYAAAVADAVDETGLDSTIFPQSCPFTAAQIRDHAFFPA